MWKTTWSSSRFRCTTTVLSQDLVENENVGQRGETGIACMDRGGLEHEACKGIVEQKQQTIQIQLLMIQKWKLCCSHFLRLNNPLNSCQLPRRVRTCRLFCLKAALFHVDFDTFLSAEKHLWEPQAFRSHTTPAVFAHFSVWSLSPSDNVSVSKMKQDLSGEQALETFTFSPTRPIGGAVATALVPKAVPLSTSPQAEHCSSTVLLNISIL